MPAPPPTIRTPWPARSPRLVLTAASLIAVVSAALSSRLPVKADLSHLLPPGALSVRDLDAIKSRAQAVGSLLVGIEADHPAARAAAARDLVPRLQALDPSLVARVIADDGSLRRHVWRHRHLYVPVPELEQADEELRSRLARANPLFVDLHTEDDDENDGQAATSKPPENRLEALRARMDEAEVRARNPSPLVSKDQRLQMVIVRATFPSADVSRSRRLQAEVQAMIDATLAAAPPGVRIGASGDIITVTVEQESIVRGMAFATALTAILVGLVALEALESRRTGSRTARALPAAAEPARAPVAVSSGDEAA